MQVDESAKEVCPDPGFYGPLSNHEAEVMPFTVQTSLHLWPLPAPSLQPFGRQGS